MATTTSDMNIQSTYEELCAAESLPTVLRNILVEYLQPTEEEKLMEELETLIEQDYCWYDCQGTYDPPQPTCRDCARIEKCMSRLSEILDDKTVKYSQGVLTII